MRRFTRRRVRRTGGRIRRVINYTPCDPDPPRTGAWVSRTSTRRLHSVLCVLISLYIILIGRARKSNKKKKTKNRKGQKGQFDDRSNSREETNARRHLTTRRARPELTAVRTVLFSSVSVRRRRSTSSRSEKHFDCRPATSRPDLCTLNTVNGSYIYV